MAIIARRLRRGSVRFFDLFSKNASRDEVVSTFLALLELIKVGRASVTQDAAYAEILIIPATPDNPESSAAEGEFDA